jgi:hypothetical protein
VNDFAQRSFRARGKSVGLDAEADREVVVLIDHTSDFLLPYMTSEWADLAPGLVRDWVKTVEGLDPGISLGEVFPDMLPSGSSLLGPVPDPPPSQPSALSPLVLPPMSRTPSSGSAGSHPPRESAVEPAARPTRPLPRPVYRLRESPSSDEVLEPSPSSDTVVPPAAVRRRVIPDVVNSSSSASPAADSPGAAGASPAASLPSAQQQPATEVVLVPMDQRPAGWLTCTYCSKRKQKCAPEVGAKPPFRSCAACLNSGLRCVPVPKTAGTWVGSVCLSC